MECVWGSGHVVWGEEEEKPKSSLSAGWSLVEEIPVVAASSPVGPPGGDAHLRKDYEGRKELSGRSIYIYIYMYILI